MNIRVECVTVDMYQEIYQFEKKNKAFFELNLPPRPEGYQHFDSFKTIMDQLIFEQKSGVFYMYIIRDENEEFVGRINLQISETENSLKADLGYRVDFEKKGKGFANQAISLVLIEAFEKLKVSEVTAGTSKDNIASQRVLEKNGFQKIGEEKKVMKVNNEWVDGIVYSTKR